LTAECASNENATGFLKVTCTAIRNDPRATHLGDIAWHAGPRQLGLHLIDVNLVMGNLLDIVSAETKTYLKK